ncbi:Nucleoid occlusion protein [subsurface metagenome]
MDVLREKIELPDNMMRQSVSEKGLEDLMGSIKEIGMINPLTVRKKGEGYELIAGLRRYMAADILKMEKVPVNVKRAGDERAEKIKMAENKAREEVDPIDEGVFFGKLMETFGWKQKQLAERFRVSESYVSQRMSATNWPEILRNAVQGGQLSFSVCREFAGIRFPEELERIVDQAIRGGVTPAVAARWRHEINRGDLRSEEMDGEGVEAMGGVLDPAMLYSCQICGGPGQEIGYKLIRVCKDCLVVIKDGQEQGVFVKAETEKEAAK